MSPQNIATTTAAAHLALCECPFQLTPQVCGCPPGTFFFFKKKQEVNGEKEGGEGMQGRGGRSGEKMSETHF